VAIAYAVAVGIVFVAAQVVVASVLMAVDMQDDPHLDPSEWAEENAESGMLLASCYLGGAAAAVPLALRLGRKLGAALNQDVLGLRWPNRRSLVAWTLAALAYCGASDLITWLRGDDIVPPEMIEIYVSATFPALLWTAVIVAAPAFEELLFRGLLFGGLVHSLGFVGTALLTSTIWASMHVQYGVAEIAQIAIGGLLLAAARHFSKSVYPCLAMHAAWNAVATIETAWFAAR
jgi:membrane protease YdiL (CAAX protease family)